VPDPPSRSGGTPAGEAARGRVSRPPKPPRSPAETPAPRAGGASSRGDPPGADAHLGGFGTQPSPGNKRAAGFGGGSKADESRYLAELQRAIAKHRYYPARARRRGIEGTVALSFVIDADGRIGEIRIADGSGSEVLDDAGLQTVQRLGRFKPIPKSIGRNRWALRVPIRFALE
jgi:protein TonB